ncbi:MAG: EAL domain-containing protein [Pseudomonadota bacterium]|nr:EAL domain-containing protein [Pseudomonadota bacterium]
MNPQAAATNSAANADVGTQAARGDEAAREPSSRWSALATLAPASAAFALAAAAQWSGEPGLAAIASGAWAALLVGFLLNLEEPAALRMTGSAALAGAAAAGGHVIAGGPPVAAAIQACVMVAGSLLCFVLLRWKRVDPAGLRDARAFALTAALGAGALPLCHLLAAGLTGSGSGGPWQLWPMAALGVVATLPLALAAAANIRTVPNRRRPMIALLSWLPLPLLLWWQPMMLPLGLLPLLAAASWLGPRWTAAAVMLSGATMAAAAVVGAATGALAGATLLAVVMLPAAQAIALLSTQRRIADVAMQASRDQLRILTERSPMLIATLDARGRHQTTNRSYLQWLGKDAAQVFDKPVQQVFGSAAMTGAFQRAVAGQPQRQQIELDDGRMLDLQLEPRFSSEGPVDGVHLIGQDASWRAAQERLVEALLAGAMDPSLVLDAAGMVLRLNKRCQALLGATTASLRGEPLSAWLRPGADESVAAALTRVRETRESQQLPRGLELHALHAGGDAFPIELQFAPIEGPRGLQVIVALRDLRPQIEFEKLMVGTRNKAEITLDAIGDAVVACDLQQRITVFNPAAAQMSGWSEREALGSPLAEVLRFVDAQTGAQVPSLLGDAITRNAAIRKHADKLLLRRDGKSAAVAESAAPMRDQFGQTSGGVVLLHDVSHTHAQAQTLTHQAQHDHLTGLPNRVLLHDRLSQALAQMDRGYKGALLYLDLDRFKPINDRLGHPVGDRVLQEVAKRLRECVREDDTVSRQGGDEFVLLLVRLADPRDAARVAGKLIEAIERPIAVDGHELGISASIGIALFPQDGRDTATVTRNADAALYHAKDGGRGRYSYFTDIMGASAEERMRTEHDLRIALSNGDFRLAWQPQVRLPGEGICGVEALLRWRQFDGTMVLPEDFLQVAEETGLLVQIDEWVLREACRQSRQWQIEAQASGALPLPVSVNVSLARFDADRLLTHVRKVLQDTGLEPQWLEIEFKGAQLFAHDSAGQALVAALRTLGVRVAVDDFGSGQANLGALAQFGFHTLKIDRGFIARVDEDVQARAVIRAVLGIGMAMGIRVIAKGVENQEQFDALLELGCTGMQGRMFGEPGPADQFTNRSGTGANLSQKSAATVAAILPG